MTKKDIETLQHVLRSYRKYLEYLGDLAERRARIKNELHDPSRPIILDGLPHGTEKTDGMDRVAKYIDQLDQLDAQIDAEMVKTMTNCREVYGIIAKLPYGDERRVLEMRYLDGAHGWDIAEKINCSIATVWRRHSAGLAMLAELPEVQAIIQRYA